MFKRGVGLVVGGLAAVALVSASAGAASLGVAKGAPITVRANPDNGIVAATKTAAAQVGFGAVTAVGFHPDCSPIAGQVVVCRNPNLSRAGVKAVTSPGQNSCVIMTDPRVGGSQHGVNVMTKALQKCVSS